LKQVNSKDFLRILSRVDALEQHKDAENSLQVDNNHLPSGGPRTGALGVGSAGRTGKGHALTWGSRSAWRDSVPQNWADGLGSTTSVPWDRVGRTFLLIVFSDASASGCRGRPVSGAVLLGRMPVVFKATRQSLTEGEGDGGRLQLSWLCPCSLPSP